MVKCVGNMMQFLEKKLLAKFKITRSLVKNIFVLHLILLLLVFLISQFASFLVGYVKVRVLGVMTPSESRFSNFSCVGNRFCKKFFVMSCILSSDYPELQCGFQDPATPIMEGVIDLHNDIVAFLIVIVTLVVWMLSVAIFFHSDRYPNS